jgi:hypothetical protein
MIAACAVHIPLPRIPAHVTIVRDGRVVPRHPPKTQRKTRPTTQPKTQPKTPTSATPTTTRRPKPSQPSKPWLQTADEIRVTRPARLTFVLYGNRYTIPHAHLTLACARVLLRSGRHADRPKLLAIRLTSGRIEVRAGRRARRALVLTPEMLALAKTSGTRFAVERNPRARSTHATTKHVPMIAAEASLPSLRITERATYTAIADARGLRLDIWPFAISPRQRQTRPSDRLTPFWADGQPCSVGCTPPGVTAGWPIRPFHRQHALRAGINELRPANFHVGVDVVAHNGTNVYPIQSGVVHIRYDGTGDVNVDVGAFDYWHIRPTVSEGRWANAYRTKLGWVLYNFKHVAVSEGHGTYINPLRPGGSLRPYHDSEPPVIGRPRVYADGRVIVGAFDPQSFVEKASFEIPVLAPAALAWRLYDRHGRALTALNWAMRGSQNYPPAVKSVIFAPGAANPGYFCFAFHVRCIPNWVYWLAGGLAPRLPLGSLARGRYRLTVYAWDWAGNTSALDEPLAIPLAHAAAAPTGPLSPRFDFQ